MHSNTTAAVVALQQQHVQHPTHPPCTAAQQHVLTVRDYVHARCVALSYWDLRAFTIPRRIGDQGRLLSTPPARRVSLVLIGAVLLPTTLGACVTRPCGRGGSGGAREQKRHTETGIQSGRVI